MDKKFYEKISNVFKKMDPETINAISGIIGLGMLGVTIRSNSFKKAKAVSEEQKRRDHIRNMDSQIRANRRLNRREMNRSGSVVQDSYIPWMTQSDMSSIMDAYNEYKELGI